MTLALCSVEPLAAVPLNLFLGKGHVRSGT